MFELETRIINHNLTIIPKTEEYLNQQLISYDYFDTWLDEVLEDENILVSNNFNSYEVNVVKLWETFTLNSKTCLGEYATYNFNEMNKGNFTTRKLFARLKISAPKFGYILDHLVVNENGKSVRYWEFKKVTAKIVPVVQNTQNTQNSGQINTVEIQSTVQKTTAEIEDTDEIEITDIVDEVETVEY